MIIKSYYRSDENDSLEDFDWQDRICIIVKTDEKQLELDFEDGENEDNNLSRNFSDCLSIEEALILAYNAGKNGEELKLEQLKQDE